MGLSSSLSDKNDLRGAFDNIGVLMSESELDELMGEVGGPCNVMGMVNMFQESWLEMATTLMSSSSRPSWPTIRPARLTSRCSSTPSPPGELFYNPKVEEAAPAEDEDADAKKKKKKKKKAA